MRKGERLAGLFTGVGDPGQVRQWGKGIGSGHEDTLVPRRVASARGGRPLDPSTCTFGAFRAPSAAGGVSCFRSGTGGDYAHVHGIE